MAQTKISVLAIDPGLHESAWVVLHCDSKAPVDYDIVTNDSFVQSLSDDVCWRDCKHLAIEMVASYGMPVGEDIFETAVWIGRFIQAWDGPYTKVYRRDVKLTLCHDSRARDSNIRQALIDRYLPMGGGKTPQIGTKALPGPLYGIRKDLWSALAIGLTWIEKHRQAQ